MSRLLLVIDMQKGFCEPGHPLFVGEQVKEVIRYIRERIEEVNAQGEWVFFTGDRHLPDDPEFRMFPPHCVEGSDQAEVLPELIGGARQARFFPKRRYSGFFGTRLEEELRRVRPERVDVVGVCTNICVLYTVEELRNREYAVRVHRQGVTSFDPKAHEFALAQMRDVLGAELV